MLATSTDWLTKAGKQPQGSFVQHPGGTITAVEMVPKKSPAPKSKLRRADTVIGNTALVVPGLQIIEEEEAR